MIEEEHIRGTLTRTGPGHNILLVSNENGIPWSVDYDSSRENTESLGSGSWVYDEEDASTHHNDEE